MTDYSEEDPESGLALDAARARPDFGWVHSAGVAPYFAGFVESLLPEEDEILALRSGRVPMESVDLIQDGLQERYMCICAPVSVVLPTYFTILGQLYGFARTLIDLTLNEVDYEYARYVMPFPTFRTEVTVELT